MKDWIERRKNARRNRQLRAYFVMRKIAKRMAKKLGTTLENDELEFLVDIRQDYFDLVGTVDDNIRRFDLVSIIV